MRYLMFIKSDEKHRNQRPPDALMAAMGGFIEKSFKNGTLIDTAGLLPSAAGTRIRSHGGQLTVTDGPFAESKEIIGGYAMVQADSREAAMALAMEFMELHRIHWPEFECESEVRPVEEFLNGPAGKSWGETRRARPTARAARYLARPSCGTPDPRGRS